VNDALFECFLSCKGNWEQSSIVLNARSKHEQKKKGKIRWMSEKEMLERFPQDVVEHMKSEKTLENKQAMDHPDLLKASLEVRLKNRMYRVFDALLETETDTFETDILLTTGEIAVTEDQAKAFT
jgi:hypothetical protein